MPASSGTAAPGLPVADVTVSLRPAAGRRQRPNGDRACRDLPPRSPAGAARSPWHRASRRPGSNCGRRSPDHHSARGRAAGPPTQASVPGVVSPLGLVRARHRSTAATVEDREEDAGPSPTRVIDLAPGLPGPRAVYYPARSESVFFNQSVRHRCAPRKFSRHFSRPAPAGTQRRLLHRAVSRDADRGGMVASADATAASELRSGPGGPAYRSAPPAGRARLRRPISSRPGCNTTGRKIRCTAPFAAASRKLKTSQLDQLVVGRVRQDRLSMSMVADGRRASGSAGSTRHRFDSSPTIMSPCSATTSPQPANTGTATCAVRRGQNAPSFRRARTCWGWKVPPDSGRHVAHQRDSPKKDVLAAKPSSVISGPTAAGRCWDWWSIPAPGCHEASGEAGRGTH